MKDMEAIWVAHEERSFPARRDGEVASELVCNLPVEQRHCVICGLRVGICGLGGFGVCWYGRRLRSREERRAIIGLDNRLVLRGDSGMGNA